MLNPIIKTLSFASLLITGVVLSLRAQPSVQQEIHFSRQSMTVKEILAEMQGQTELHFSYGNTSLINKKVDLNMVQASRLYPQSSQRHADTSKTSPTTLRMKVSDVLKKIKQETGLQYQVKCDKVMLLSFSLLQF